MFNNAVFDQRTGRYRSGGRFVSASAVNNAIEARIESGFRQLDDLLLGALDPSTPYNLDDFRQAFALELRNLHVQMAVIGGGGRGNMTPTQWGRVGRRLRDEYAYMNGLIDDIQNARLTERQIRARMGQYANKVKTSFHGARQQVAVDAGLTESRRILNPADHCADCVRFAGLGWQPIGFLPLPGDNSECRSNCRCGIQYR